MCSKALRYARSHHADRSARCCAHGSSYCLTTNCRRTRGKSARTNGNAYNCGRYNFR